MHFFAKMRAFACIFAKLRAKIEMMTHQNTKHPQKNAHFAKCACIVAFCMQHARMLHAKCVHAKMREKIEVMTHRFLETMSHLFYLRMFSMQAY